MCENVRFNNSIFSYMLEANFIVDPEDLKKVIVPHPVAITFIDISKIKFLGETGMKMAAAGFRFFVTKKLAEELIKENIAIARATTK